MEDQSERTYSVEDGWVLDTEAAIDAPGAKAPYVDNGTELIEAGRYFESAFRQAEWDKLWTQTWLLAGRESDLAEPGDFFTFDVGTESFIVVRTKDGGIRAMYNVCQHRGTRLVLTDFGSATKFRCLYHSWAWTTEGEIAEITDRETYRPKVLSGSLDLPQIRCSTWGGWVFVCMSEEAPPLEQFLDVLPTHLAAYDFGAMVVVKDVQVTWPVNWKTALDAFLESYHVHAVHPEILPFFDDYHQQWDMYGNGMSRMLMQFAAVSPRHADQHSVNDILGAMLREVGIDPATFGGDASAVREAVQRAKLDTSAHDRGYSHAQMTDDWNYHIFPNVTLNAHPEGVLVQRFRPHPSDPEQCIYDVTVLVHPIKDPAVGLPAYMGVPDGTDCSGTYRPERTHLTRGDGGLGYVLEQDSVVVPFVQQGMRSRGYKGARLSEQEQRIRHYHREIDRYLANGKW